MTRFTLKETMQITPQELQKIETLLDSSDKSNVELGLTILSGFAVDSVGVRWLFEYYQRLEQIEASAASFNLQSILIGTMDSKATKASRVLTLLLEKAPYEEQLKILKNFIEGKILTLPRLEFSEFPKALFSFEELEVINWQYGNLETLTTDILQFKNLKRLDLRHQPLMMIEEAIVEHSTLMELWIGNALIVTEDLADNSTFDIFIEAAY